MDLSETAGKQGRRRPGAVVDPEPPSGRSIAA